MKDILETIIVNLVDDKEAVQINEVEGEKFDDDGYSSESIENEAYNTDYSTEDESTSKEFLV